MNIEQTIIASRLYVADMHAKRLAMSLKHLSAILPLTKNSLETMSDENLGYLELLTNRFSKLQDFMGSKIFPVVLELMYENSPELSFVDRLNKLEKLGIIKDSEQWLKMRSMRNMLAHEYPDQYEVIARNFVEICECVEILLAYWQTLRAKIIELQKSSGQ